MAISKFNLDKGVVDWFHVFPAPRTDNGMKLCSPLWVFWYLTCLSSEPYFVSFTADLPVGYKFEAMENAKQVHGIPLPGDWDRNEKDWSKIADDVLEFLTVSWGYKSLVSLSVVKLALLMCLVRFFSLICVWFLFLSPTMEMKSHQFSLWMEPLQEEVISIVKYRQWKISLILFLTSRVSNMCTSSFSPSYPLFFSSTESI